MEEALRNAFERLRPYLHYTSQEREEKEIEAILIELVDFAAYNGSEARFFLQEVASNANPRISC